MAFEIAGLPTWDFVFALTALKWFLMVVGLGVGAFFLGRVMMYNYKVIILEKRGKVDQIIAVDYGRLKKNSKGMLRFQLLKSKATVDIPDFEYVHGSKFSLFQSKCLFLYKYGEKSFTPIALTNVFDTNSVTLTAIETDLSQMVSILDEIDSKFDTKDFLAQYGQVIAYGILIVAFIGSIIFLGEMLQSNAGALASTAQAFQHAADTLGQCSAAPAPGFGG